MYEEEARLRGAEHLKQLENESESSELFKHKLAAHENENVRFKMEITRQFKDAITRQANEAVCIHDRPSQELLNSKSEFNHPPMARVVVNRRKVGSGYCRSVLFFSHFFWIPSLKYI